MLHIPYLHILAKYINFNILHQHTSETQDQVLASQDTSHSSAPGTCTPRDPKVLPARKLSTVITRIVWCIERNRIINMKAHVYKSKMWDYRSSSVINLRVYKRWLQPKTEAAAQMNEKRENKSALASKPANTQHRCSLTGINITD